MRETRHPHPHIDPRQPRDGARPRTNPPVFAWKPPVGASTFHLRVARSADLADAVIDRANLAEPLFLPERALEPGAYWWQWSAGEARGEVFAFEIARDAVVVEVPPVEEWLRRFGTGHPRLYVRPADLESLRASRDGARGEKWQRLKAFADATLPLCHKIQEPPFLPDRRVNYQAYFEPWVRALRESRRFVREAENLALAYLVSGDERYARAACERMVSIARWDPHGSSHISHNDEAHMSCIWDGTKAIDWAWDAFTDDERELVIRQYRERGRITFEHMHDKGSYGVTRFDSHAGREIVFLALLAIVFHEHIPEAVEWLRWLRPVLCGVWPIWAGDDGGWAEGLHYGLAYVGIMQMFATALKRGTGVDLYARPFWKGHARWRQWCLPTYAEWTGFGDGTECTGSFLERNAGLVETVAEETGDSSLVGFVGRLRAAAHAREAAKRDAKPDGAPSPQAVDSIRFLGGGPPAGDGDGGGGETLSVFPGAGWAAFRTDLGDAPPDVALLFRSSPYGAVSHSHANNNDFIVHVAGKAMAMPSGYYVGYGSGHHAHWVWHTKSHNCVTLSDAGQLMRSHDSLGAIASSYEDDAIAYLCGDADASYADRAERCRRHVVFLKRHRCFVMIDDFAARAGVVSALQWNVHSWARFETDLDARTFRLERDGSTLEGHFMYHHNAFFTLGEGWDPPMMGIKDPSHWPMQYHLRFTADGLVTRRRLGVVLCAGHATLAPPEVRTERSGSAEVAHVGSDVAIVNQDERFEYEGIASNAMAVLRVGGTRYDVTDEGIARVTG